PAVGAPAARARLTWRSAGRGARLLDEPAYVAAQAEHRLGVAHIVAPAHATAAVDEREARAVEDRLVALRGVALGDRQEETLAGELPDDRVVAGQEEPARPVRPESCSVLRQLLRRVARRVDGDRDQAEVRH